MLEKYPLIQPFAHHSKFGVFKKIVFWLGLILAILFLVGFFSWRHLKTAALKKEQKTAAPSSFLQQIGEIKETASLMTSVLGYEKPQTYLVLFLNSTELRPGGGFIGSYGLVKMEKGRLTLFETNGSENLDWAAPADFNIESPFPIKEYLKQPRWFFRDSNWSPDFPSSAKLSLWFYRFEGGREGTKIDGVIGLTPKVVESLINLTGPLEINGKKFTAANFTEALEYQVEYGYKEEGKTIDERKVIIGELGDALFKRIFSLPPWRWKDIWSLFVKLAEERQVMIFSNNEKTQDILVRNDWAGEMKAVAGDYLLAVDSNLASLKTDPSVKRQIIYEIVPENNRLKAKVTINYDHQGHFDWKTTRYRSYTRIYVPFGSQLVKATGFMDKDGKDRAAEIEEELGRTVFGGFFSLEPQEKKSLILEYYLPEKIRQDVEAGLYTLFVQKQLGTAVVPLTLDLDFGKKKESGQPGNYHQETDLRVDRQFKISL